MLEPGETFDPENPCPHGIYRLTQKEAERDCLAYLKRLDQEELASTVAPPTEEDYSVLSEPLVMP